LANAREEKALALTHENIGRANRCGRTAAGALLRLIPRIARGWWEEIEVEIEEIQDAKMIELKPRYRALRNRARFFEEALRCFSPLESNRQPGSPMNIRATLSEVTSR
jgi:hypothetical protein